MWELAAKLSFIIAYNRHENVVDTNVMLVDVATGSLEW